MSENNLNIIMNLSKITKNTIRRNKQSLIEKRIQTAHPNYSQELRDQLSFLVNTIQKEKIIKSNILGSYMANPKK